MKNSNPFEGKWRVVDMEIWDQDFVDMEVPGFIEINDDETGSFQFGAVVGNIDGRVEQLEDGLVLEFSWAGRDGSMPACGRGWLVVEEEEVSGRFYIHMGDDSAFLAQPF